MKGRAARVVWCPRLQLRSPLIGFALRARVRSRGTVETGFSGYSDLAVTRDGTILLFYERDSTDGKNIFKTGFLTLARFNLEWLTDKKDALLPGSGKD